MSEKRTLSEEEFEALGVNNNGGDLFTYDQVKDADLYHVWSIVDGDEDDGVYAVPGFHVVNMLGYVLTDAPWSEDSDFDLAVYTAPRPLHEVTYTRPEDGGLYVALVRAWDEDEAGSEVEWDYCLKPENIIKVRLVSEGEVE